MRLSSFLTAISSGLLCVPIVGYAQGDRPLVETKANSPTTTVTKEEMEKIPGKRDVLKILQEMPDPASGNPPTVISSSSPGFISKVRTPPGIHTLSFTTPQKDVIEVYLPNKILNSHSFTATMKVIPGVGNGPNGTKGYSIMIDQQNIKVASDRFDVFVAGALQDLQLKLLDPTGKEVAGAKVPLWPESSMPPAPTTPTSGTTGDLLVVHCPCDGRLAPGTYFKIGGKLMQILTSTPGTIVVLNTYPEPGLTQIETNVGNEVRMSRFRNVTLRASADKYDLLKGESTQLHVVVSGLEDLRAPAKMTIDATGSISMGGGNSQKLAIAPSAISEKGTFTTGNALTALSAGKFGVKVVVTVEREIF